ncbi:MAG: SDR family NAD(P)-dependent oxidoreductase [Rhodospirillaceae bacterium]|nr:SDR family NAD(P)-dependent oxidoreductase [Rhodospirillaceae bacterium]
MTVTLPPPSSGCAWVTGASSGIGRALALRLARDGWRVAASARGDAALDDLAKEAAGGPGSIDPMPLDVTDEEGTRAATIAIEARNGPIVLAVLNAGTHLPISVATFDPSIFRRLHEVNVMGVVNGIAALLPRMVERRGGHIAVVSSVAGYRGLPTAAAYGATKAALINMCEALKFDLDRCGIRLSLVNPGFVKTPLTDENPFPMPFLMSAEDAADRLVRGLASGGFEITFPRRFALLLKALRCLPYRLYFPILKRATGL